MDAGWAAAPDWPQRQTRIARALERASGAGRRRRCWSPMARSPVRCPFARPRRSPAWLRALTPAAWETRYPEDSTGLLAGAPPSGLTTLWLSDGLDHPGRAALLAALAARGEVTVVPPDSARLALQMVPGDRPALRLNATSAAEPPAVLALGVDPQGMPRELARLKPDEAATQSGVTSRIYPIDLPSELRNRITRFEIEGQRSAGADLVLRTTPCAGVRWRWSAMTAPAKPSACCRPCITCAGRWPPAPT